ncbi:MAG: SRPBCC family protein [Actinomycetota bacterium]
MTTTMQVTTTQVYQVFIKSTPERIWEAITKPEFTAKYFHGARVETTAEKGASIRYYAPDGTTVWHDDVVIESDPPRRLVASWRALWDEETAAEPASRVTWEIEQREDGLCLLTVVHDQLEQSPVTAGRVSGTGWMMVLSGLKTLLETGEPMKDEW